MVAVSLAKDNRIAVVDPTLGKVAHMVDISRSAGNLVLAPDGRSAWVFGAKADQAVVGSFDVLNGNRSDDFKFQPGDGPSTVAFSTDGSRAYIALAGGVSATAANNTIEFASSAGKEIGRINVGRQTAGVQIRRQLSSLAVSQGANGDVLYAAGQSSGVVWALDGGTGALLEEINVGGGPTNLVADPARQRMYALIDTLNQIVAIDTTSFAVTNRLDLPARPIGAAVAPDGTIYIAGGDASGEVWQIEPSATDIRSRVAIGGRPVGLAMSADNRALYIPDTATRTLAVLTTDTVQVVRSIPLAAEPLGMAVVHPQSARQRPATVAAPAAPAVALAPPPTPVPDGVLPPDSLPAGTVAETYLSGAELPVALAFAPDGRLFYNELRTGRIRVVQNGMLLPDPFYQFSVADQTDGTGLLGLALDPDFQRNHYVYAFYTSPGDGSKPSHAAGGADPEQQLPPPGPNQVVRLTDVGNKGADLTPIAQDLPSSATHNGGSLGFGPDGKLYVSLGESDGGTSGQDLTTLAGKILRYNPDGSIPDDNPFVGQTGKQDAIWAYGVHNATSFAFHPIGRGLLALDSKAGAADELNLIAPGGNYGAPAAGYQYKPGMEDPIAVMSPAIGPTGSTFYTGDQLPEWKNDMFYCNYSSSQLRRVRLAISSFDRVVSEEVVKQGCTYGVLTGPDGALYYSDARGIYRLRRTGADVLPQVRMSVLPLPNAPSVPSVVPAPAVKDQPSH
jgi:glucose/arabinose dehydrogenase